MQADVFLYNRVVNILVCPDKFKGSLSATEVCDAVSNAIHKVLPSAVVQAVPLADGGEGTMALLTRLSGGSMISVVVRGPLFRPVTAEYGISADGETAFIEMALASGLLLLKPHERNPLNTSSVGTGDLIVHALDRGVKRIVLGIGGSATNDAGIGMASALGYTFMDASGNELQPIGENLIHLRTILPNHGRADNLHPRLSEVKVTLLCDVSNPLYGPDGAAFVYGPQKGANETDIRILDAGLRNFRRVVHKQLGISVDFPGAGAAGGLGAGARVFLHASVEKGVKHILEAVRFEEKLKAADVVITGEGKIDAQSFSGKVVSEVVRRSTKSGKVVYALCGKSELSAEDIHRLGIKKLVSLVDKRTPADQAIKDAANLIGERIRELFSYQYPE